MPIIKQVYSDYIQSKQHWDERPHHNEIRTSRNNEMIYSGLCGTFLIPSLIGSKYFYFSLMITIETWAYFLKEKNSTLKILKFSRHWWRMEGRRLTL